MFVLPEAGNETGEPAPRHPRLHPRRCRGRSLEGPRDRQRVGVDLSTSPHYRRGHIPGAWFAIRGRLDKALPKIAPRQAIILTSEDGVLAGLAVDEARALTKTPVHWLKGGNAAWTAAGFPLSTAEKMADEPLDVWLKPYERPNDNEAAMNAYLSWEVDLLERIKRDGTTHFLHAR